MSSTSNVQDLLVNVFRPTYKYQPGTGFVPSLVLSNVSEIITDRVKTGALVVSDINSNTYIGSNAGEGASNTASNVGIGYQAMSGSLNSSNNVALGAFSLDGVANSSSNVAVGDRTDITGRGFKNVLLGPNITMVDGSYNILIGADISAGSGNYRFQLGNFLYGDLSAGKFGVNTSAPATAFDVSGISYFRGKVGIQNPTPDYSLDVNGSLYVSDRLLVGPGTQIAPIYGFRDLSSGMYQATDASYGTGAVGISVDSMARLVVTSNKTYIYGDLVVEGTGGGGGSGTIASNGTATAPSFTFSNDLSTGLHLVRTSTLAFDTSGVQRMCISGGFVGIGTPAPRVALDVSGDISANVYNGPGGTQTAPHYTFSDDRTTGIFFPGANMVGFTAGGTERMRISNSNVGIGTRAPSNALDVSGTLRVIGVAGDITLTNGAISIAGTPVISSSGVLSNGATTSNSIGGVTLSNSNAIVGGALRNALVPTTYDISDGNISNSGTTRSSNFLAGLGATTTPAFAFGTVAGTGLYQASDASYGTGALGVAVNQSARVVVMSNKTILYGNLDICGTVSAAAGISGGGGGGGGTIATDGTVSAPSFTFSNDSATGLYLQSASNLGVSTGGVNRMSILSTGDVSMAQMTASQYIRGTTAGVRTLDMSGGNIAYAGQLINSGTGSNRIGGITLSNAFITGATTTTSVRFRAGDGTRSLPSFTFSNATGTGLYSATDVSYGTGALGVAVNASARIVVMSNKTFIYGDVDICGTVSAAAGGGAATATTEVVHYITSNNASLPFPTGYSNAHVTLVGGGGGGGGSGGDGYGTVGCGGGGGSGYTVSQLLRGANTLAITIGTGGAGGVGYTYTAGAPGSNGTATEIVYGSSYLKAPGGFGGGEGYISSGAGGAGTYGGGGGGAPTESVTAGSAGQGKWVDGQPGTTPDGGEGGGASGNGGSGIGGGGGGGGGPRGGKGGNTNAALTLGSNGVVGGDGCGGGGGGAGSETAGNGAAGGNGYCIVRFLP
jgi:hypothetical protein